MAIIGIAGKIGSGKDLVGEIIQYLTSNYYKSGYSLEYFRQQNKKRNDYPLYLDWQIVKFADALKDMVCILTGCTREQLEDTNFKNSHLADEWKQDIESTKAITYRKLLQKLGTDLLRNQLHENVWVNALMNNYKPEYKFNDRSKATVENWHNTKFPNWIITDCRFPNELEAIKNREGVSIRVNREDITGQGKFNPHTSETALDNAGFDYVIDNNSDIQALIDKVKIILKKENIL